MCCISRRDRSHQLADGRGGPKRLRQAMRALIVPSGFANERKSRSDRRVAVLADTVKQAARKRAEPRDRLRQPNRSSTATDQMAAARIARLPYSLARAPSGCTIVEDPFGRSSEFPTLFAWSNEFTDCRIGGKPEALDRAVIAPEAGALPGCATLRHASILYYFPAP